MLLQYADARARRLQTMFYYCTAYVIDELTIFILYEVECT